MRNFAADSLQKQQNAYRPQRMQSRLRLQIPCKCRFQRGMRYSGKPAMLAANSAAEAASGPIAPAACAGAPRR